MSSSRHIQEWYRQTFDTHYNGLCNYALAIVKDEQTAEDVVQAVYLNVWERREQLFGEEKIRHFLLRAVKNKCIDHWRQARKIDHMENMPEQGVAPASPDGGAEDQELKALLSAAISSLPEKTRQVFLGSRRDGLTYVEIAEDQGISVKTVENQMSRALRLLREYFQDRPWMWLWFFLWW